MAGLPLESQNLLKELDLVKKFKNPSPVQGIEPGPLGWKSGVVASRPLIVSFLTVKTSAFQYTYRTRAIITRGLYTFYPIFEGQKRFFKVLFS